jgi:hypothetical protein
VQLQSLPYVEQQQQQLQRDQHQQQQQQQRQWQPPQQQMEGRYLSGDKDMLGLLLRQAVRAAAEVPRSRL